MSWVMPGLVTLLLSACENPLDCIIDDRPVLNTENFRQPVLNQVWDATITVSVKNNTHDNDFDYRWDVDGVLPPGVRFDVDRRQLEFSGTPTALGSYPITIDVYVSSDNDWQNDRDPDASDLCRQSVRRSFTLAVAPL